MEGAPSNDTRLMTPFGGIAAGSGKSDSDSACPEESLIFERRLSSRRGDVQVCLESERTWSGLSVT
jgi:hypothetical protein